METLSNNPFAAVAKALHGCGCRHAIVGGFAVVMHGSGRFTPDVNLALDLQSQDLRAGLLALSEIGLACASSAKILDFLQPEVRQRLYDPSVREKRFFSLRSTEFPLFSVELFFEPPLPFDQLWEEGQTITYAEGGFRICSMPHLIRMKEEAHRAQDLMDLESLKTLQILESLQIKEPIDWSAVHRAAPPADDDRVMDLLSFRQLPPQEKLEWLYRMLQALGGLGI